MFSNRFARRSQRLLTSVRMPSPVGHALAGLIVGGVLRPARWRATNRETAGVSLRALGILALLGALPDIDFLVGRHSRESHSVGAVAVVGLVSWLLSWRAMRHPVLQAGARPAMMWSLACALAYASHILLDWLGSDTSPPIGIQALWPFSHEFYQSGFHVFYAVDRRFWLPGFASNLVVMLAWELLVLAPLAAIACGLHRRRPSARPRQAPTTNDQ